MEKRDLYTITTLVHRAATTKNTIPVLTGLLIEASNNNGLTMTATDMEIGIKASTNSVEIIEEGTVLVNAHYFSDFIRLLPDGPITLELNKEKAKLNIKYGRSSSFINTYHNYEYPNLPLDTIQKKFSIPQKILKEALRKTSFATAFTHFRQVFTGVLFDIPKDNTLKIVASDTHRLACYTYKLEENLEPFNFIIPTRTVNELQRILDDSDESINIGFSGNYVIFSKENFILLSRLIEGQYPNYEQVIPTNFTTSLKINTAILMETLERARTMPTDDKLKIQYVSLTINENEMMVNSYSEIMGEIEEVIEDITTEGEKDFKIAFNTNYFFDIIKLFASETEKTDIKLSGNLGSALITNPNKDNYLYVLVPLRTSN